MSPRTRAGGAAILLLLAAPATARAVPVMDPLKPCYVTADTQRGPQSEPVQITATGFTPNSDVQVAIDGVLEPETAKAGVAGELSFALSAPFIERGSRSFTTRRRQIPIRRAGLGTWTIQFDQYRRYRDPAVQSFVYVRLGIRIRLVRG